MKFAWYQVSAQDRKQFSFSYESDASKLGDFPVPLEFSDDANVNALGDWDNTWSRTRTIKQCSPHNGRYKNKNIQ